jgi:hypothetical protein
MNKYSAKSKRGSRKLFFCIWVLISIFLSQFNYAEEWTIAGDTTPPLFFYEKSLPKGIVYEVLRKVALSMGHEVFARKLPYRRVQAELLSGRVHLSVLMVRDLGQLPSSSELIIGREPLMSLPVVVGALKVRKIEVDSVEQIKLLHVGHLRTVPRPNSYLSTAYRHTSFGTAESMLKSLFRQRVDVVVTGLPTFEYAIEQLGIRNQVEEIHRLDRAYLYLVWSRIAMGADGVLLAQKADKSLREMKLEGQVSAIIKKYADLQTFGDYGVVVH